MITVSLEDKKEWSQLPATLQLLEELNDMCRSKFESLLVSSTEERNRTIDEIRGIQEVIGLVTSWR